MPAAVTRILSDVHFGDRASLLGRIEELEPLTRGVSALVFNGDTLDTRQGPNPDHTALCRAELAAFVRRTGLPCTFLTGNHDPDISSVHSTELAGGEIFVVHGDVLFEDMVPWGRDARTIRRLIRQALADRGHSPLPLEEKLDIWRRVAAAIPQRHQSERNLLKYAFRFAVDTVWPPNRFFEILRAWQREPSLAAKLVTDSGLRPRYVLLGHTHRPRVRTSSEGMKVINTGSFTAPFGGFVVDVTDQSLVVRKVERRSREFHAGEVISEFPLANIEAREFEVRP